MAARKKVETGEQRRNIKKSVSSKIAKVENDLPQEDLQVSTSSKPKKSIVTKRNVILLVSAIVLAGLLYYFKSLFIAAVVNGEPISRLSVVKDIESRYGKQSLDSMVTQNLIFQEARKQNITVAQSEVDDQIKQIEENLKSSGQTLDQALASQGMSKNTLETQIRLQKLIEKILGKDIQVSDKDVDDYITKNKDLFPKDMKAEDIKKNAKQDLTQQKLSEKFQTWITDLKSKAKIQYFVKY